jgi:hypothetical protein
MWSHRKASVHGGLWHGSQARVKRPGQAGVHPKGVAVSGAIRTSQLVLQNSPAVFTVLTKLGEGAQNR